MYHVTRRRLTLAATALAVAAVGAVASAEPAAAIVGGQDATQSYPGTTVVQILYPGLGTALCGGALIQPDVVLTAAHCVSDDAAAPKPVPVPAANITVRIGSTDRTTGGQVATGRRVFLPAGWAWASNWPSPVSDYALIELDRPVQSQLMPLALHPAGVGDAVRLLGWGLTKYPPTAGPPALLQQQDTVRLPTTTCDGGFISDGEACYGGGACYGDSGSPAVRSSISAGASRDPRWSQVGIASRETSTERPCVEPTIYTDLTSIRVRLWVATTIRTRHAEACTCPPTVLNPATRGRIDRLKPQIVP
ncbi:trypsin-like serine protease [Dactylosporangium sp. NPDC050688]|uniref:S1 family peptidase n=1 Tax=Dactylosporangium sp. NPDC050688 TaxID=3157217 RepID=UPI0033DD600C